MRTISVNIDIVIVCVMSRKQCFSFVTVVDIGLVVVY